MLKLNTKSGQAQTGSSLIEVLVTMVILAFGLLGLAGLQVQVQKMQFESFQRAQANTLISEMSDRLSANRILASGYVTSGTIGTGDAQPSDCSTKVAGSAAKDICEWSNALKGANETLGSNSVGAMVGARGCVTLLQAQDLSTGVCKPAIYQITVAWQGLYPTTAQTITCGSGLYGTDDSLRRAITVQTTVGLPSCS